MGDTGLDYKIKIGQVNKDCAIFIKIAKLPQN